MLRRDRVARLVHDRAERGALLRETPLKAPRAHPERTREALFARRPHRERLREGARRARSDRLGLEPLDERRQHTVHLCGEGLVAARQRTSERLAAKHERGEWRAKNDGSAERLLVARTERTFRTCDEHPHRTHAVVLDEHRRQSYAGAQKGVFDDCVLRPSAACLADDEEIFAVLLERINEVVAEHTRESDETQKRFPRRRAREAGIEQYVECARVHEVGDAEPEGRIARRFQRETKELELRRSRNTRAGEAKALGTEPGLERELGPVQPARLERVEHRRAQRSRGARNDGGGSTRARRVARRSPHDASVPATRPTRYA